MANIQTAMVIKLSNRQSDVNYWHVIVSQLSLDAVIIWTSSVSSCLPTPCEHPSLLEGNANGLITRRFVSEIRSVRTTWISSTFLLRRLLFGEKTGAANLRIGPFCPSVSHFCFCCERLDRSSAINFHLKFVGVLFVTSAGAKVDNPNKNGVVVFDCSSGGGSSFAAIPDLMSPSVETPVLNKRAWARARGK